MTVKATALMPTAALVTAQTTQYTAPPLTTSLIDKMTVTNGGTTALTLTAYIVTAGGAAGAGNKLISAQPIAAGASYGCPEIAGHVLKPGDFVVTETSGAGLVGRISGREVQ